VNEKGNLRRFQRLIREVQRGEEGEEDLRRDRKTLKSARLYMPGQSTRNNAGDKPCLPLREGTLSQVGRYLVRSSLTTYLPSDNRPFCQQGVFFPVSAFVVSPPHTALCKVPNRS